MPHRCHALGCLIHVPPEMLMCRKHWAMVPKAYQERVWTTYRNGQCADKGPSFAWCQAADIAVAVVAEKEGKKVHLGKTFEKSFYPNGHPKF
jgi:hypothetical protein